MTRETDPSQSTTSRRDLLRRGALVTGAAALGVGAGAGSALAGCSGKHACARTPGFWKNHTESWHGGDHLHLGTTDDEQDRYNYFTSFDSRPSVLTILQTSASGDKTLILAHQLIATLLNLKAGSDPTCIAETVEAARAWLENHGGVGSNQREWDGGEAIKDRLDAYNNGELCACPAD